MENIVTNYDENVVKEPIETEHIEIKVTRGKNAGKVKAELNYMYPTTLIAGVDMDGEEAVLSLYLKARREAAIVSATKKPAKVTNKALMEALKAAEEKDPEYVNRIKKDLGLA